MLNHATLGDVSQLIKSNSPDTSDIKAQLHRVEKRQRMKALLLVLPLIVFISVTFVLPILEMLYRSVHNDLIASNLPGTVALLQEWDSAAPPNEGTYKILAKELKVLGANKQIGRVASRLNSQNSGMRSLLMRTARKLKRIEQPVLWSSAMVDISGKWSKPETFMAIKVLGNPYSFTSYLAALDLKIDASGAVVSQPESRQIYLGLFAKTLGITLIITFVCFLLGYPLAWYLAHLPEKKANLLLILVLLPFWTSLLVRTTAWIVLLQNEGVINDLLMYLGIISERLEMMHNMTGTVIAMTHILLPFMILPLYSVMKNIPPTYMKAARSMGAKPFYAFLKVYFPQTLPGVGAGSILVFILAIGFYITPALVGGSNGQMISNFIAYHMQTSLNWGLASALGGILLIMVVLIYLAYNRFIGISNLKIG